MISRILNITTASNGFQLNWVIFRSTKSASCVVPMVFGLSDMVAYRVIHKTVYGSLGSYGGEGPPRVVR